MELNFEDFEIQKDRAQSNLECLMEGGFGIKGG